MTDLLGSAILYDTLCDNYNETNLMVEEDKIITNRNISSMGETFQLLYLRKNNKENTVPEYNNDEREYNRDFDRYTVLNEVMPEDYDVLNEIPITKCASWTIRKDFADPSFIVSTITHALSKLEVTNVKTIVAMVNKKRYLTDAASIFEVSMNEGQIYVNKLSTATLDRTLYKIKH